MQSNLPSQYSIIGTVTSGMDIVTKVGDAGVTGATDQHRRTRRSCR